MLERSAYIVVCCDEKTAGCECVGERTIELFASFSASCDLSSYPIHDRAYVCFTSYTTVLWTLLILFFFFCCLPQIETQKQDRKASYSDLKSTWTDVFRLCKTREILCWKYFEKDSLEELSSAFEKNRRAVSERMKCAVYSFSCNKIPLNAKVAKATRTINFYERKKSEQLPITHLQLLD